MDRDGPISDLRRGDEDLRLSGLVVLVVIIIRDCFEGDLCGLSLFPTWPGVLVILAKSYPEFCLFRFFICDWRFSISYGFSSSIDIFLHLFCC